MPFAEVPNALDTLLRPIAQWIQPVVGDGPQWGWSLIGICFTVRLLCWPGVMRSLRSQVIKLRGRHHAEAQYAELPPPERRKAVQAAVLGELRDRGLRSGVQAISTTIQFVLFILVLIWVRFGDVAGSYGFYGLERLRDSSIGSGVSGVVLALLFMASSVAMQVLILRTAAIDSVRQHFFATRMLPVIFLAVGLFLPTGAVLAWLAANVATLIVIATGAHQPAAAVEAS